MTEKRVLQHSLQVAGRCRAIGTVSRFLFRWEGHGSVGAPLAARSSNVEGKGIYHRGHRAHRGKTGFLSDLCALCGESAFDRGQLSRRQRRYSLRSPYGPTCGRCFATLRSYGKGMESWRGHQSPGITRLSRCSRNRAGFISPSTRDSGSSVPAGVKNTSAGRPRMLYCSMIAWLSALISVISTR